MRVLTIISILLTYLFWGIPSYSQYFGDGLTAYFNGDYASAFKEWEPLAERGDADSQYHLGMMYDKGQGVRKDYREAVRLYSLAAAQGYSAAQYALGYAYINGNGVIQDPVYAHMWWNIAASNGYNETAKESKELLERMMTSSQLVEAQRLERECVKKNYIGC